MDKKEILFPYEDIRPTQDALITEVMNAVNEKKHLIVHAPTGIGKTVAVLAPSLAYALKNNLTIFFVTPRHTQHRIAVDTLKKIKGIYNVDFTVVDFIGKKWMCPIAGTNLISSRDFAEYCRDMREKELCLYFLNTKNNIKTKMMLKKLQELNPSHVEEVCRLCNESELCPYEVSALLAKKATVIIADYHHLFSEGIKDALFKRMEKAVENSIIIIDEAHNIADRTRDILTERISNFTIKAAINEAKEIDNDKVVELLEYLGNILENLANKIHSDKNGIFVKREDFTSEVEKLYRYEIFTAELEFAAAKVREEKKRSFIGGVAKFMNHWLGQDYGFTRILHKSFFKEKPQIVLTYRCLDPSLITKPLIESSHTTIIMSGTLNPLEMYEDLFGFQKENTIERAYKDPFPKENKLYFIVPTITTKFTKRSQDMYEKIAKETANIVNAVPGNCAVFFPSYNLRDESYIYFEPLSNKTIFREQQGLSKEEREMLIERFKSYKDAGAVLLAVSTGSLGEGIDLPGDFLKAVVVVGLPLPKPDLETEALIDYYDKKFGKGWDYGYVFPAFIKTLQNAGRCIRSEKDRGVIVFLDERYTWHSYMKLFPSDLNIQITKNPVEEIKRFFKESKPQQTLNEF